MKRSLLVSKNILVVDADLANEIGINKAVILQQIHCWTEKNEELKRNYRDGHYWVYNSFENWANQFKWINVRTIKKLIKELEEDGYIITGVYNKSSFDHTKWYRVNYDKVDELMRECNNFTIERENTTPTIPETTTETNNGIMDIMVSSSKDEETSPMAPPISVPKVHKSDEDISGFIDWYFDYYRHIKDVAHPLLKSAQLIKVHDTLKAFCDENDIDSDKLKTMAEVFFDMYTSDHNINHFATAGILENRYYEAVY